MSIAGNIVLCSWARHVTLTVPLSIQEYKWVLANLMMGVTSRSTSIPSRGKRNIPNRFMLQNSELSAGVSIFRLGTSCTLTFLIGKKNISLDDTSCLCLSDFAQNHSYENVFPLQIHFHANQSHFHMKSFARSEDY